MENVDNLVLWPDAEWKTIGSSFVGWSRAYREKELQMFVEAPLRATTSKQWLSVGKRMGCTFPWVLCKVPSQQLRKDDSGGGTS